VSFVTGKCQSNEDVETVNSGNQRRVVKNFLAAAPKWKHPKRAAEWFREKKKKTRL